jgi:hypothetical protein
MICPNADVVFSAAGALIARVLGRRFALVFGRDAVAVAPRFFADEDDDDDRAAVDFPDLPDFPDFIFTERLDRADFPAVRVAMRASPCSPNGIEPPSPCHT